MSKVNESRIDKLNSDERIDNFDFERFFGSSFEKELQKHLIQMGAFDSKI